MHNPVLQLYALTACLLASLSTQAADTTELKVKGTVRPAACSLALSAGGTIDYGVIPVSRLSETKTTWLEMRTLNVSVTCDGKISTSLKLDDNRAGSVISNMIPFRSGMRDEWLRDIYTYGLGTVKGKKTGIYTVMLRKFVGDGEARSTRIDALDGKGYGSTGSSTDFPLYFVKGYKISGQEASTLNRQAYTTITATLEVRVLIDKLPNLPTEGEIPLDGSATLELVYN